MISFCAFILILPLIIGGSCNRKPNWCTISVKYKGETAVYKRFDCCTFTDFSFNETESNIVVKVVLEKLPTTTPTTTP